MWIPPHEKIMVLKSSNPWNGAGSQEAFRNKLLEQVNELYDLAAKHDAVGIRKKMQEIVPEFEVQDSVCVL